MMLLFCVVMISADIVLALPEDKYTKVVHNGSYGLIGSGPLKGLHVWRDEGYNQPWNNKLLIEEFRGTVLSAGGEWPDGVDIIVEVVGPGECGSVKGQIAGKNGWFRFKGMKEGLYTFKITCMGWISIVGELEISKSAKTSEPITFLLGLH